jgi:RNA recognition motif-containing protein
VKTEEEKKRDRERKRKRAKEKRNAWHDSAEHANVYVTGLPFDVTMEEMEETFKKGGIIKQDDNGQPKIKLYKDASGVQKGDGLVSYLRNESVQMAVDLLDETEIRPKFKIRVQKAEFRQKGTRQIAIRLTTVGMPCSAARDLPPLSGRLCVSVCLCVCAGDQYVAKPKAAAEKKESGDKTAEKAKKARKHMQSKELAWDSGDDEDVDDSGQPKYKGLRIVILQHVFKREDAADDPNFYDELRVCLSCDRCILIRCGELTPRYAALCCV